MTNKLGLMLLRQVGIVNLTIGLGGTGATQPSDHCTWYMKILFQLLQCWYCEVLIYYRENVFLVDRFENMICGAA